MIYYYSRQYDILITLNGDVWTEYHKNDVIALVNAYLDMEEITKEEYEQIMLRLL